MVRVCGSPYVKKSSCPTSSPLRPSTPCSTGRVIRTGPSYLRSAWSGPCSPIFRPSPICITPSYSYPHISSSPVISYTPASSASGVVAAITILSLVALSWIAIAASQDCHYTGEECSVADMFGNQLCHSVWDCKW
jgi:hypothetical protein